MKKFIIVSKSKVPILEFQKLKSEANSKGLLWIPVEPSFQHSESSRQGCLQNQPTAVFKVPA